MAAKNAKPLENQRRTRPAMTPEGRESQMTALAVDLVEQRLRDGTATSQETTHYLKLASPVEKLKQEKLEKEIALIDAKISAIESEQRIEEMYMNALNAMRTYSGGLNVKDEY